MLSTADLSLLPDIRDLKALTQSLALLDAILCPEWSHRYHSFVCNWGDDESLAWMRNGQGDGYFCLFNADGALLKGFWHEAPMSPFRVDPPQIWPGVLDDVPPQFAAILAEPAFIRDETTFCIWRTHDDVNWQHGDIQFPETEITDGSTQLLELLTGDPQLYQDWAERYYECSVNLDAVTHIYRHEPLVESVIQSLNPELSLESLTEDIAEIGYGNCL